MLGALKKLGIAAGSIVVAFLVLIVVGSVILFSDVSDDSETKRVKDLVRDSKHLIEPQKDVILNAIDTACQQGYMHGSSIGDAILAKCLATYEKRAMEEPTPPPSFSPMFQYTTDKDVYTFGEDVSITGKYIGTDVTWKHPNGSTINPTHERINLLFTLPTDLTPYRTMICTNSDDTNGWSCDTSFHGLQNDSLANNNWFSPVEHTFTVPTSEYWTGEVVVELSSVTISSGIRELPDISSSNNEEILRFEIVPVR